MGDEVIALAVYGEPTADGFHSRAAAEQGEEGVACVDDAARAAVLYAQLWQRYQRPWAREAGLGLLAFVRSMQLADGAFLNFILDWDGRQNLVGPTSRPGGGPWTARAMHALACGASAFGDEECRASFERGLPWLDRPIPYFDVRSIGLLAVTEYWRATGSDEVASRALRWANEIVAAVEDGVLPDRAGSSKVHLWGHFHEAAVAEAGMAFGRPDLVEAARRSAEAVLIPAAEQGFPGKTILPFDVSCVVRGLEAVATATGQTRYHCQAETARRWFDGENAAGEPVYDRARGLVFDGIDDGQINDNSGAESNIEGALALSDRLPVELYG
jgi:hypothetical protein